MSGGTAVLITLVVYKVVLVAIGVVANRRSKDESDYFLGGRNLGPGVAALSASASSSSVWTLIGVSGFAYTYGLSAIWLFPACVGGFALNWYLLAGPLRRRSRDWNALTVTEMLAGDRGTPGRRAVVVTASIIVLLCLLTYVAAQFQGAGKTFEVTFGVARAPAILIGAAIVVFYTLLGGFWAVSLTDTLQGMMMALAAIVLPIVALVAVGGPSGLGAGIDAVATRVEGFDSWTQGLGPVGSMALVLGLLGIALGYPGQPHVVNRLMALRDERALVLGRRVAISWAVVIYAGMIVLGLCARVLVPEIGDDENAFVVTTQQLLPPVLAGVMIASVLSAIMSTADSQLLVAASAVSHDLASSGSREARAGGGLAMSRLVVFGLSALAVVVALALDASIFSSVLSAWSAMGAAFGPALLVTVLHRRPTWPWVLASMATGFTAAVLAHALIPVHTRFWEGVIPFVLSSALLVIPALISGARLSEARTRGKDS